MNLRFLAGCAVAGLMLGLAGCGGGSGRYTGTDVAVSGTGPTEPVLGGESTVFVMTVSNIGPYDAANVTVNNLIGNQLALTGITCKASGGAVCPSPTSVSMAVPTLPAGASLTFQVNAKAVLGANGVISNTMSASFGDDNDRGNNSATVSATAASNSVGVTASAPAGPLAGGASAQFTMVVGNDGPAGATDVQLTNVLSDNLAPGGAIACVPAGGAAPTVVMPDGSLLAPSIPVAATLTCTVPVVVTAGADGIVSSTMTATAAGDARAGDNSATASVLATSSDLGVSQSGATEVGAGGPAVFTAVVSNPGPGSATNVSIVWTHTEAAGLSFGTPTCNATGGATCPAVLGPSMSVPSLAPGRSLTFRFTADTAVDYRGAVVNTVAVASDEDTTTGNNEASTTTTVVDPRNGSYTAFSADGQSYTYVIDFDSGQYSVTGNGVSLTRDFSLNTSTGDYVVSGNARLRTATDLVVGGDDFGSGLLPYIAVRKFATSVASIAGTYDLATRNVPGAGAPVTHAGTALVSGNTLSICQSDSVQVVPVRFCPAGSRTDYSALRTTGSGFTGTSSSGANYSFSVAESGALKILLSAGPASDGSQQLRIGLIDSSGGLTYGRPSHGPSTTGDWLTVTLANAGLTTAYTATGSFTSDSADLVVINPGGSGPFSMLVGTSLLYNANIYVMQASPLVVVVGGVLGSASGLLEVTLP